MDVKISVPKLHAKQQQIVEALKNNQFVAVMAGRRGGKTLCAINIAINYLIQGKRVGWFAETTKYLDESIQDIRTRMHDLIKSDNKQNDQIYFLTGGVLQYWSLFNSVDAGRGKKYDLVIIDEASVCRRLKDTWEQAILPTLADYSGKALFTGTPKGRNYFYDLWTRGQPGEGKVDDWYSLRFISRDNPYIEQRIIDLAKRELTPSMFGQEFEGLPSESSGNPFGESAIDICTWKDPKQRSSAPAIIYGCDLARKVDYCVLTGLDENANTTYIREWKGEDWSSIYRDISSQVGETPLIIDSTAMAGDIQLEQLQQICDGKVFGYPFTSKSKQELIECLAITIQKGEIRFPVGVISEQLLNFGFELTETGIRYEAIRGHDDAVCSIALANYWLRKHYGNRTTVIDLTNPSIADQKKWNEEYKVSVVEEDNRHPITREPEPVAVDWTEDRYWTDVE